MDQFWQIKTITKGGKIQIPFKQLVKNETKIRKIFEIQYRKSFYHMRLFEKIFKHCGWSFSCRYQLKQFCCICRTLSDPSGWRVPGKVAPMGKYEHEEMAFRKSIEKKSLPDLKDLLARQNAILANQKLIDKLPDKGAKVQLKKTQIEKLIESRSKTVTEASDMLQGLSIQSGIKFRKIKSFNQNEK